MISRHDTAFVYAFQTKLTDYIKTNQSHVHLIKYFSDSYSGQYKNYKSLLNLIHYERTLALTQNRHFLLQAMGNLHVMGLELQ